MRLHPLGPHLGHLLIVIASLCGPVSVLANESSRPQYVSSDPAIETLAETIVTARRRTEPLQDTPVAVSIVDAQLLDARVASTIVDFGKSMPNVRLDSVGPQGRAGMLAIRGVNYASTNQAGDPSTPLYIDGIYQSLSKLSAIPMLDLETVEVLRGPQVTLFGRNAFAGAVNIRTRRPSSEFGGSVELKVGNFGRNEVRTAIDLPVVSDRLAVRLAAMNTQSDGYFRSIRNGGAPLGGDGHTVARLNALLAIAPGWEVFVKYEVIRDRGDPSPVQNASTTAAQATTAIPSQPIGNIPGDPPNFFVYPRFWTDVTIPEGQRSFIDQQAWALELVGQFAGGELHWTGGLQRTNDGVIVDPAGGKLAYNNQYFRTDLESHSQEVRYLRELGRRWQVLVGAHYLDDDLDYGNITYSQYAPLVNANAQVRALQRRRGKAVFAEFEYRPADTVRVNVAGRQMWEDKDFAIRRTPRPPSLGVAPGVFLPVTSYETARIAWTDFSPAVSIDWRPRDGLMTYASWTHGFKSGGFAVQASSLSTAGPYDPEEIETVEVGVKSTWLDDKLRVNAALFRNDLRNLQRTVNRTQNGVLVNRVFNAASAVTQGAELELEWQPQMGIIWRASAGWLEAGYREFCANIGFPGGVSGFPIAQPCGTVAGNVDNRYLPLFNAPEWQASVSGTWTRGLGDAGEVRAHVEVNHTAPLYTEDRPYPLARRSDLTLLDASVQWRSPESRYFATLYVHNAANDIETQQSIRSGNTLTVYAHTPPRRYGVSFGVKF
jgi:iron complex outermembrane receptor protein